eukprot:GSChrysophyteH1.ASY1.ANO1.3327.1 assembled CDS
MGIHNDGRYLIGNHWLGGSDQVIKSGNTVGFFVHLSSSDVAAHSNKNKINSGSTCVNGVPLSVKINIDGRECTMSSSAMTAALQEVYKIASLEKSSEQLDLYPTVSLVSPNTRVWCRFANDDILCRNRTLIGAPTEEKVYCLDGSLLLGEKN